MSRCWQKLSCHWTGERWELDQLQSFLATNASPRIIQGHAGTAHQTPPRRGIRIHHRVETHMTHPEQRCIINLWTQCNRVAFQEVDVTISSQVVFMNSKRPVRDPFEPQQSKTRHNTTSNPFDAMATCYTSQTTPRAVTASYDHRTRARNGRC